MILSVYKGYYYILNLKKDNTKLKNKYFIQHIKKITNKWHIVKLYNKKTQFYNLSKIKKLSKFVNIEIYKQLSPQNPLEIIPFQTAYTLKKPILIKCVSKHQSHPYIGCPELCAKFINMGITEFYTSTPDNDIDNIVDVLRDPYRNIWYIYDRIKLIQLNNTPSHIVKIEEFIEHIKMKNENKKLKVKNYHDSKIYNHNLNHLKENVEKIKRGL